jgi:hypothetical protein
MRERRWFLPIMQHKWSPRIEKEKQEDVFSVRDGEGDKATYLKTPRMAANQ